MGDVRTPRLATPEDIDLIGRIGAEGFHEDPVMSWIFRDPSSRLDKLTALFHRLAQDMTADGDSEVWVVDDACVALWRKPSFEHHSAGEEDDGASPAAFPFDDEETARLGALGFTMDQTHPHEPHWYLNVVSTLPSRQGQGLGAAVIAPVLARCDAEGSRAYLESTNPRNRTLYRRSAFVDGDELLIPDGPAMLAMWRNPLT